MKRRILDGPNVDCAFSRLCSHESESRRNRGGCNFRRRVPGQGRVCQTVIGRTLIISRKLSTQPALVCQRLPDLRLKAAETLVKMCGSNEPERANVQSVEVRVDANLIEQLRAAWRA